MFTWNFWLSLSVSSKQSSKGTERGSEITEGRRRKIRERRAVAKVALIVGDDDEALFERWETRTELV